MKTIEMGMAYLTDMRPGSRVTCHAQDPLIQG